MPKFFYSVILILLLSWGGVILLVLKGSPDTYPSIFSFLIVFFISLGFSLSIPFYSFLKRKTPEFTNINLLYRKGLKYGMFIAFGITGVAFLRAFRILSLLNVGLFVLLYLGIFYQLKSKR